MWADLAVSGVLSALRRKTDYDTAKENAEAKQKWQAYKNTMVNLANASNQNILTTNQNLARERHAEQAFEVERSEYMTLGKAEVAAAATGTGGRSVNMVMFDVERNAAQQQSKLRQDLDAQFMQIDNQREASAFQAASQIDYSPIPMPDKASSMLGFAMDMTKLYQSSKPKV